MKKYLKIVIGIFSVMQLSAQDNHTLTGYSGVGSRTKIIMNDGTEKEISKIREGDTIKIIQVDSTFTYPDHSSTSLFSSSRVKKVTKLIDSCCIYVSLDNGKTLQCTRNQQLATRIQLGEIISPSPQGMYFSNWSNYYTSDSSNFLHLHGPLGLRSELQMYFVYQDGKGNLIPESKEINVIDLVCIYDKNPDKLHTMYNLELENGEAYIANGFVVKVK